MLKRNFDDSQVNPDESRREGEPQPKRPNSTSQVVNNFASSNVSQIEIPPPNARDAVNSSLTLAALLVEKRSVDKNQFFDNVLDYFDKKSEADVGVSSKPNVAIKPVIIDLDAEDSPARKSKTDPHESQLPQMIRNPKALFKKPNILRHTPDIIPISGQPFRCAVLTCDTVSRVYQSVQSSTPQSPGPRGNSTRFREIRPKQDEFTISFPPFPWTQKLECCIIEKIINRFQYFRVTPLSENVILMYINFGRPTPEIPSLGVNVTLYDHHKWLTGCPTLERLFCWMCLLFTTRVSKTQSTVWMREGFKAMNTLGTSMSKHILSNIHREAILVKDQMVKNGSIPNLLPGANLDPRDAVPPTKPPLKPPPGPPTKPVPTTAGEPIHIQKLSQEGIMKPASVSSKMISSPQTPARTPPLDSSISPSNTPNNLKQDNPLGSTATRSERKLEAFQNPPCQPETCDLTQSDDEERSSPRTVEASSPSESVKEPLTSQAECLKLMEELKTKVLTLSEPPAKNQILPPTPAAPKTRRQPKVDLIALQNKYFTNGTFNGISEQQREQMIASGRPTPDMPGLVQEMDGGTIYFSASYYDEFPWMCGCAEMNKLYCWPCFVFSDHYLTDPWNTVGCNDLANLPSAAKVHSCNLAHLDVSIRLKMIEERRKKNTRKPQLSKTELAKRNEIARKKCSLLKYLIDAVCFKKKLSNNTEICHRDFSDFLKILSSHDVKLKTLLDPKSAPCLENFTSKFVSNYSGETVNALMRILQRKIAQEVEYSVYVSFILKTVRHNLIALILRYTESTGEVYERFYKFIQIGFGLPDALLKKIVTEVKELKCSAKFVGISYDGGVLRPDQIESFNSNLRKEFMAAYFFHYQDENFKSLLQQSLTHTTFCRSFFQIVTDFGKFLRDNPRVMRFIKKVESAMPNENPKDWDLESGLIMTIRCHYSAIMKCLDLVVNRSLAPNAWSNHVISQCAKFSMFLGLAETRLFLVLFSKIFTTLHCVIEAFQGEFDAKYWKAATSDAYITILDIKTNSFGEMCVEAGNMAGFSFEGPSDSVKDRLRLSTMFRDTIEWILAFLKYRTKYIDIWDYFYLSTNRIDSPVAKSHQNQAQFLMDLRECFPFFDYQRLGSALTFAHTHAGFRNKSAAEIIQDMIEWDLKSVLPELFSFLLLIQTVPQGSAHVSSQVSGKVTAYVEGKTHLTSADAILHLEKDLLSSARNEEHFYNDVLKIIAELKPSDSELAEIIDESCK